MIEIIGRVDEMANIESSTRQPKRMPYRYPLPYLSPSILQHSLNSSQTTHWKMKIKIMFGIPSNIISRPNPLLQVIACSFVADDCASIFARRYDGKASKEKGDEDSGGERCKGDRAPSTAEEFNRVAAEKQGKEVVHDDDKGVAKESEAMEKSGVNDDDINKGPNYRPCS